MNPAPGRHVVLVDDDDMSIGSAPKSSVHTAETPLHRAFSCHIRGSDGRWLLSRRATSKLTWPGVWTNAFCGHPDRGEERVDALVRHGATELGLHIDPGDLRIALPDFRYRAVDDSGVVENEICPVWILDADVRPAPDPAEVAAFRWVGGADLDAVVERMPFLLSPWLVLQWSALRTAGLVDV